MFSFLHFKDHLLKGLNGLLHVFSPLTDYEETYMYLTSPNIYITVYSFLYGLCIGMLILTY